MACSITKRRRTKLVLFFIKERTRGSLLGSFFAQLIECDAKKVCELYGGGNAAITTSLDVLDGSARYSR